MPPYRRKRKTYRKAPYKKKAMVKIAKQVMTRTLENKQVSTLIEPVWFNNGGTSGTGSQWFPITYTVGQGTDDTAFTGSSILIKNINARLYAYTSTTNGGVDQDATFRVSLVSTVYQIGLASNPGSGVNYGYSYGEAYNPTTMHFNPNVVSVLKDFKFTIKGGEGTNPNRVLTFNKRFKRGLKLTFVEATDAANTLKYCKNKNYYMVFSFWKPNATTSVGSVGGVESMMQIKYKDI